MSERPRVKVIGTGGSISCVSRTRIDYINYSHDNVHLSIEEMLARVPEAADIAELTSAQFLNIYGGDVHPNDWVRLAQQVNACFLADERLAGIVITHGTASLEETAYFLNLTVRSRKPVVVTGAMRPPTTLGTDADLNLLDSIRVASDGGAQGMGVLVVMNNEIQAARDVSKTSSTRLHTFRSADLGCLGYADADGRVVFYRTPAKAHTYATEFDVTTLDALPSVEIAYAYSGAGGYLIDAMVEHQVRGIVAAGMGSGNAPAEFMAALGKARAAGLTVVISTQTGSGRVKTANKFIEQGFVLADNLTPKKARILLMLALTKQVEASDVQRLMETY